MTRMDLRSTIVLAGMVILPLLSQRTLSQRVAMPGPPPPELQQLHQLPTELAERNRVADLAGTMIPPDAPDYLFHTYRSSLRAPPFTPAPRKIVNVPEHLAKYKQLCRPDHIYNHAAFPSIVREHENDSDSTGCEGTYLPNGSVTTSSHGFFEVLGTNGRSCATCHQPPSGMSVSTSNIDARLHATSGTDPIFAGVDGANCPDNLPPFTGGGSAFKAAHSLLLQRGLFRIFLPMRSDAQFTVAVEHDPTGCNTDPTFATDPTPSTGDSTQMISAYRRPLISANMNFIEATQNAPPPTPSGAAIMWDTRELTLQQQAVDATFGHGHAQALVPPTPLQVTQMVLFETTVFSAQSVDQRAGRLDVAGAKGGPIALSAAPTGLNGPPAGATFDEYSSWAGSTGNAIKARRASIARGEVLFNTNSFNLTNLAGVNDVLNKPSFPATCSGCHSETHAGNDIFGKPSVFDLGVAGDAVAYNGPPPLSDLPTFKVTCTGGKSTPYNGSTVTTNDLGFAMISGQCADIGKFSVPQLRALASHAPYFHNGSAKTLADVVGFYDKRFAIGLTPAQRVDLVHFLESL